MALLTHTLSCLFGIGSWVAINGMWVELPLIVPDIPEGWYLPSYLTVLIQMANIGPLFVTLMHRFHPGKLSEVAVIYTIIGVGILASFLLAFFWKETLVVAGSSRSVALLVLTFFLSTVDCTSSVTFLPFMMRLKPQYMTTYFIGEGLSGLVPGLVALVQGVGMVKCINQTQTINGSFGNSTASLELQAWYQPAMFSAQVFFFFLSVMMVVCLGAFLLLNYHPNVRREHKSSRYLEGGIHGENGELSPRENSQPEQKPMISPLESQQPAAQSSFGSGKYSWPECLFLFVVLGWANALTNAVLPAVQSYSCLPYGNNAYHMSATLGAVANPVACFITMFLPNRSFLLLGVLTLAGTGFGSYIMTTAVLSPCPFLIHYSTGAVLIVMAWVLFVLSLSYVKVMIGVILRDEGHSALVWCGAVVQLGSMLGALTMFPLVSVFGLFKPGDSCNTKCPI